MIDRAEILRFGDEFGLEPRIVREILEVVRDERGQFDQFVIVGRWIVLKLANRDALGLLFAQRNRAKTSDAEQRQNHEADLSYPTLFDAPH